jgi:hypothetical protein
VVLVGKLSLLGHLGKDDRFDSIGEVIAGDTLGEEGFFEEGSVKRRETTLVEEQNTYLMEIRKDSFSIIKNQLKSSDLSLDWFTLMNYMKRQWT